MKIQNNRHLIAFIISATLYGVAIGSILGFDIKDSDLSNPQVEEFKTVKISLVSDTTFGSIDQQKQMPIIQKQQEIIPQKEESIVKEKKIEETIKKVTEPQKIIQNTPIIEKIVKNEFVEQPKRIEKNTQVLKEEKIEKQEPQKEIIAKQIQLQETQLKTPIVSKAPNVEKVEKKEIAKSVVDEIDLKNKKKAYFQLVKNTIEKHKYYPKNALRRGIECDVKVKFIVSQMGQLVSLELIEGNKMFHDSVKEAIESSFPLLPPKNILVDNEVVSLVISYTIN